MITTVFIPFLLLMLSGTLWGLIPHAPDRSAVRLVLGSVVFNIFLPALTFRVLYQAPVNDELWAVPAVSASTCLITLALAWAVYEILFRFLRSRPPRPSEGALILAAAWSNATYLGLPVVTAAFGEYMQRVPILFDLLALTPLLLTIGAKTASQYGGSRKIKIDPYSLLKIPPLWAGALGLVLNLLKVPIPQVVLASCNLAASAVAPMMIFAVGLALRFSAISRLPLVITTVVLKLGFAPALAFALAAFLGLKGRVNSAVIVEASMPTMVLTMVIADRYDLDTELLAQSIAVSTVLSFITIPLIIRMLF
jgi:malate permease and related proteins